ncbi:MAG: EpsG family protein [Lachnospiraceae bacterium]
MIIYIGLTILVLVLAYFVKNETYMQYHTQGGVRYGCERQQAFNAMLCFVIFVALTAVSACRIAVGNDYWVYRENFKLIYMGRVVASEIGFNTVVYYMQELFGYNNYLPIFGLFSIVTCAFFSKALYDQSKYFMFSLFIFMTSGYYFNSLNNIRYYLAIAITMYATKYVLRGEYFKFILWILFGAMFHKSIILVIPSYIILRMVSNIKINKWITLVVTLALSSMLFFEDVYRSIIFYFYPFYENSSFDNGEVSIVNIAKGIAVVGLALLFYKKSVLGNPRMQFFLWLNIVGLAINMFGSFIPEVTRIGNYFYISQIYFIPEILMKIKHPVWKRLLLIGTSIAFLLYFALFLYKSYDVNIRLLPYLNWIFN